MVAWRCLSSPFVEKETESCKVVLSWQEIDRYLGGKHEKLCLEVFSLSFKSLLEELSPSEESSPSFSVPQSSWTGTLSCVCQLCSCTFISCMSFVLAR